MDKWMYRFFGTLYYNSSAVDFSQGPVNPWNVFMYVNKCRYGGIEIPAELCVVHSFWIRANYVYV